MAAPASPQYEFTYILDGVLADDQIKDLVGRVGKFIANNGGEVVETDEWGMRPLAYPIRNRNNGYYVNLYFNSDSELPAKLDRTLRIEESILRYLILKLDPKMRRHFYKEKAKRAAEPESKPESDES